MSFKEDTGWGQTVVILGKWDVGCLLKNFHFLWCWNQFSLDDFYFFPCSWNSLTLAWIFKVSHLQHHLLAEHHEFRLNVAMEKFCLLVVPSEFTSVNLWVITPKPSAQAAFAKGVLGEGERDRERVKPSFGLSACKEASGFHWYMRSKEKNTPVFFRLGERWKSSFGGTVRGLYNSLLLVIFWKRLRKLWELTST